jgi:fatty-acyl-CoA synthase
VVAIVACRPGQPPDPVALREACAQTLARYKAPRAFAFVERVARHPNGKGDYRWARQVADTAISIGAETTAQ